MTMEGRRKRIRLNDSSAEENSTTGKPTSEILNDDCLLHIFEYLPIRDRIRLQRVNKHWSAISKTSWLNFKTLTFTNDLWGCKNEEKVTKKALKKVLLQCGKYLKVLDMSVTPVLAEKVDISSLLKLCPNLTSVDFKSLTVGVPLIKSLVKYCKGIVELRIGTTTYYLNGQHINDTVLSTYTNLQVLHLNAIRFFDKDVFPINLKHNITIKELNLEYCTMSNLAEILPQLQNLHTLSLRGCAGLCKSLAELDFTKLPNLKKLDIYDSGWFIDDSFLITLARSCTHLTSLSVGDNCDVTDEGLRAIVSSCNIEHLSIDNYFFITSRITGSSLSNLPSLKTLSCRCCMNLDPQYFKYLFDTSDKLEVIDLRNIYRDNVTDEIIRIAMESVKSRKNGITLRMLVDATDTHFGDMPDNLILVRRDI